MPLFPIITAAVAAFVALAWVTTFTLVPVIEADLVDRARSIASREELRWVEASASGQNLRLTGMVPNYEARNEALQLGAAIWGVANVEDGMTIAGTSGACQEEINAVLQREPIEFRPDSAVPLGTSRFVLTLLAAVTLNCRQLIEIAAHTDAEGDPAANLALSQDRADAVRAYLVASGVPAQRLEAIGYGDLRPIYDTSTEDGRRRNRRVELRALGEAS